MKKHLAKSKDFALCAGSAASECVTEFTKHIHFSANAVSRAMDTANGGVLKYGGFHRVFGGHSITDAEMWHRFGIRFAKEVGKDSLTPNGVPLPGTETLASKGWIKMSAAQNWGSVSVGNILASGLAGLDTGLNARKFAKDRKAFRERSTLVLIKGGVKMATAAMSANGPLMILGACDVGMALYAKVEARGSERPAVARSRRPRAGHSKGAKTRARKVYSKPSKIRPKKARQYKARKALQAV